MPLSVLGINYYSTVTVRQQYSGEAPKSQADGHGDSDASPWVGADDVEFLPQPGPYTAMGWNIDPTGMTELLLDLGTRYPDLPLMITENGAAFYDEVVDADGRVHDADRIATCTGTSTRSARPSTPASTSAVTSSGRCWTTSSGPGATTAGSASSASTTTPSCAPSRILPAGMRS